MEYRYSETVKINYEATSDHGLPLFLFHGFGLTKESFRPWIPILVKEYRIITIDLFYHGASLKPFKTLHKKEWIDIFRGLLDHLAIDAFSVGGFSLGGRFAIPIALELPGKCKELILIGPDAIYKTPWFLAATHPAFRWLFKYFMDHDVALHQLISKAVKLRIISRYMADFVEKELHDKENRKRVYYSWNHFKPLGYSKRTLIANLKKSTLKKYLILGSKDIIIHPSKIMPIVEDCGFKVSILDKKHHQLMNEETARVIAKNRMDNS